MPAIGAIAGIAGAAIGGTTGAVIGAVGTAAGSLIGSKSSSKAQTAGIDAATKLQADIYNQNREDMTPWREAGVRGLNALQYGLGLYNPYSTTTAPATNTGTTKTTGATQTAPRTNTGATTPTVQGGKTAAQYLHERGMDKYIGIIGDPNKPLTALALSLLSKNIGNIQRYGDNKAGQSGYFDFLGTTGTPYMQGSTNQGATTNTAPTGATTDATGGQAPSGITFGQFTKNFTPSDLYTDPSYKWRLEQGQKALERSAAARGGLLSGGTMKDLTDYAQGAASQEYGAAYNRYNNDRDSLYNKLAGLSGTGQTAQSEIAGYGQSYANDAAGAAIAKGNIKANQIADQSKIMNNTLSGLGTNWSNSSSGGGLNNLFSSGWSSNPYSGSNIKWN